MIENTSQFDINTDFFLYTNQKVLIKDVSKKKKAEKKIWMTLPWANEESNLSHTMKEWYHPVFDDGRASNESDHHGYASGC